MLPWSSCMASSLPPCLHQLYHAGTPDPAACTAPLRMTTGNRVWHHLRTMSADRGLFWHLTPLYLLLQMSGTHGAPCVTCAGAEADVSTRMLSQQAQQQRAQEQALQLQRVQACLAEMLDGLNCPIRWALDL